MKNLSQEAITPELALIFLLSKEEHLNLITPIVFWNELFGIQREIQDLIVGMQETNAKKHHDTNVSGLKPITWAAFNEQCERVN